MVGKGRRVANFLRSRWLDQRPEKQPELQASGFSDHSALRALCAFVVRIPDYLPKVLAWDKIYGSR